MERLVRVSSCRLGGLEERKFRFRSQQENYPRIGNVKLAGLARFQLLSLYRERVHSRLFTRVLFYTGHFAPSRLNISRNADEASCTFRFPWLRASVILIPDVSRPRIFGGMHMDTLAFHFYDIDSVHFCSRKWNEMWRGNFFFLLFIDKEKVVLR